MMRNSQSPFHPASCSKKFRSILHHDAGSARTLSASELTALLKLITDHTMVQGVAIEDGCIVDVNPATGEVIGKIPVSTPEQVAAAIATANAAQPVRRTPPAARTTSKRCACCESASRRGSESALLTAGSQGRWNESLPPT